MIEIQSTAIDPSQVLQSVASDQAGASVLFVGSTREWTEGKQTASLDYECYESMAIQKLRELESEARRRWPLIGCSLVHRIGPVDIGEASVVIAVSSAHRKPAFEAGQWLIDTLKLEVPIWKRENWVDGQQQWIHPSETTKPPSLPAATEAADTTPASNSPRPSNPS
jgi:molybdopterin synthase catalytic subunit